VTTPLTRSPVRTGGRDPYKSSPRALSYDTMRSLGPYGRVRHEELDEGDVVLYENSAYCVIEKVTCPSDVLLILRELGSDQVRRSRLGRLGRIPRLRLSRLVEGMGEPWEMQKGDVVVYLADKAEDTFLAVRQNAMWGRTKAPWVPLSDAEVLVDLRAGRARVLRSSNHLRGIDPREMLQVGAVAATRYGAAGDHSAWMRVAHNEWVGNVRAVEMSDAMVRYELLRGTYQLLPNPRTLNS